MKIYSSQSTVLGKRKARQLNGSGNLVLHLTSPCSVSENLLGTSDSETSALGQSKFSDKTHILVNGSFIADTKKRYCCTHRGCEKAYSKPSRLAEHERSHTGQVSFSSARIRFFLHYFFFSVIL